MAALESASVNQDIKPFAAFLASLVKEPANQLDRRDYDPREWTG